MNNGTIILPDPTSYLKYGATGLAALMLVLVIVALAIGNLTAGKERLLFRFMYIGFFCFVVSALLLFFERAESYLIHFRIDPLDLGAVPNMPEPVIIVNGRRLPNSPREYKIKSEVTAIVDVHDAIEKIQQGLEINAQQAEVLNKVSQVADVAIMKLNSAKQLASDDRCIGDRRRSFASRYPRSSQIVALNSSAADALTNVKAQIKAAQSLKIKPAIKN